MEVGFFDLSQHCALRRIKIQILAEMNPDWLCAAIASIPEPSGAHPPLLIELHISKIPHCIGKEKHQSWEEYDVKKMRNWWGPVNEQLLRLTRLSLDNYSGISALGSTTARIKLDFISGAGETCSKRGAARLMFPDANLNYFFY